MYEASEYLLNKPERVMPPIKIEDLPTEVEDIKSQIQKATAARQINDFKN